MNSIFSQVKEHVTARDAAEYYGISVNRHSMASCPFHPDRTPSMKLDENFVCFSCGAKGNVIDLVAKLFDLSPYEAAQKIASDFGLNIEDQDRAAGEPDSVADQREQSLAEQQRFDSIVDHLYDIYCGAFRVLNGWTVENKSMSPDNELYPYLVGISKIRDRVELILDALLYGSVEDKARIIIMTGKGVDLEKLQERIERIES